MPAPPAEDEAVTAAVEKYTLRPIEEEVRRQTLMYTAPSHLPCCIYHTKSSTVGADPEDEAVTAAVEKYTLRPIEEEVRRPSLLYIPPRHPPFCVCRSKSYPQCYVYPLFCVCRTESSTVLCIPHHSMYTKPSHPPWISTPSGPSKKEVSMQDPQQRVEAPYRQVAWLRIHSIADKWACTLPVRNQRTKSAGKNSINLKH
jgi:hypothetical protein